MAQTKNDLYPKPPRTTAGRHPRMHRGGDEVLFDANAGVDMIPTEGDKPRFRKGQHVWLLTEEGEGGLPLRVKTVLAKGYYTLERRPGAVDWGDWVGVHEDALAGSVREAERESLAIFCDGLTQQLVRLRARIRVLDEQGRAEADRKRWAKSSLARRKDYRARV